MLVKRTMSKNVVSVSVPGNRDKVLDLMRKEKKAVLPVVKEDTDILVGLVTRSDLINNPDEEQIAMLMTRDLITVNPSDDVVVAAQKMIENDVRRVPVVNDDGELVGIIGVPLAKVATWIMQGAKLKDFNLTKEIKIDHVAVKESVFPFLKLPESDTVLGPEMKSTGESIGIDENYGMAFYKSQRYLYGSAINRKILWSKIL